MSETQHAPEGAAPEPASTPAEGTEAPAEDTAEPGDARAESKPEPDKPEREPWFVKRIAELTRANADRDRVLAQAERRLQELAPKPDPNAPPDVHALAEQRAQQLVAEREFNSACNAAHTQGVNEYPDFQEAMTTLGRAGGLPNTVIEAALETGDAARVLYALGKDPARAMEVKEMSPARMGVALARLAAQPIAAAPVTKAPAPLRTIGGGTVKDVADPERMSMAEFTAWREKTIAARRPH